MSETIEDFVPYAVTVASSFNVHLTEEQLKVLLNREERVLSRQAVNKIIFDYSNDPFPIEPPVAEISATIQSQAQPVAAQPVVAQPVVAQPVVAQPVVAQPVVAQPVAAQPVAAQPVAAQPIDVEAMMRNFWATVPEGTMDAITSVAGISLEENLSKKSDEFKKRHAEMEKAFAEYFSARRNIEDSVKLSEDGMTNLINYLFSSGRWTNIKAHGTSIGVITADTVSDVMVGGAENPAFLGKFRIVINTRMPPHIMRILPIGNNMKFTQNYIDSAHPMFSDMGIPSIPPGQAIIDSYVNFDFVPLLQYFEQKIWDTTIALPLRGTAMSAEEMKYMANYISDVFAISRQISTP